MNLTREQITAMLDGLDGVTPGPWAVEGLNQWHNFSVAWKPELKVCQTYGDSIAAEADAAHIARCDPDTIRALCELALERLDMKRRALKDQDSDLPDITLGEACEEIRQLHKAGERLRAENERLLEALEKIGQKNTYAEMDGTDPMLADWIVGYDECVAVARAALERKPE